MKRKLDIKVKIVLISLGLLFSLLFFEIIFGMSTFTNRVLFLPKYDLANVNKNNLIIFCLGDSFTYGIGAGFANSYPAQLEKILNKTSNGSKVRVFNFGVPGYNSSQTLQTLKRKIKKLKPDIVILLCGVNDSWNFNAVSLKSNFNAIQSCLVRLKAYEIFIIFAKNLQYKIFQKDNAVNNQKYAKMLEQENDFLRLIYYGNIFRRFNFYREARLFYNKARMLRHDEPIVFIELGRCYKLNHEYRQSIYVLGQALRNWPDNKDVQAELEDVFIQSGMAEESIRFYEIFLNEHSANEFAVSALVGKYIKVGGDYFLNNKIQTAIGFYKKALLLNSKQSSAIFDAIQMMEKCYVQIKFYKNANLKLNLGKWGKVIAGNFFIQTPIGQQLAEDSVTDNLTEMIEICKKNNIKIIFSGYPTGSEDSAVYETVRDMALTYGVSFVDHRGSFDEALKHKPFEYYFISHSDPHCTKEGYRIMAENIAKQIFKYMENKL